VKILECYITPVEFTIGEVHVKKGTWIMAVRVIDDALWESVKTGDLTGFSIGGSARRVPEPNANKAPTEAQAA
jgi:DNA adenine methylase